MVTANEMTEREWINLLDALVYFWPLWAWIMAVMIVGAIVLAFWIIAVSLLRRVTS
jgi:hypothetical protein